MLTARRARLLRRLFGFDAILWGSYISTSPARILMRIETARPEPKEEHAAQQDLLWRDVNLFMALDDIENEGLIVDQEDWLDAQVAIAMALVHALNARNLGSDELSVGLDKLRLSGRRNRHVIITTLVKDGLFVLTPASCDRGHSDFRSSPTAKEVLLDATGKWLGHQLSPYIMSDEQLPEEFLEEVAEVCTQLQPWDAGNLYRLAAIKLLLGKSDEARSAIEAAYSRDSVSRRIPMTALSAYASVAISLLDSSSLRATASTAQCAVYIARAVSRGGEKVRNDLAEELKKTLVYQTLTPDEPLSVPHAIILELLHLDRPVRAQS